jgi:retron-type reverse transcriptase
VWKAIRGNDLRKAKSLQKLILKSRAARLLAIRQVTQLNAGKKTSGIDGKASLTYQERLSLSNYLKLNVNSWKHQGLREIPIPKKDGSTRLLKVPTMADRAWQCLVKYALEPAHKQHSINGVTGSDREERHMTLKKSYSTTYAHPPME